MDYITYRALVDKVKNIVDQQWDYWLNELKYDKNINLCELPKEDYDFICEKIDIAVEPYFEPPISLKPWGYCCPGWNYKRKFA